MALFLGIVLSSLFAGEWHDNTSTLVLTTRNGWGKIALAKISYWFSVYSGVICITCCFKCYITVVF